MTESITIKLEQALDERKDFIEVISDLTAREPLSLIENNIVYIIKTGRMNLYAVQTDSTGNMLRRFFLQTFETGEILTCRENIETRVLNDSQKTIASNMLLAVSESVSSIYKIDCEKLSKSNCKEIQNYLAEAISDFHEKASHNFQNRIETIIESEQKTLKQRKQMEQAYTRGTYKKAAMIFAKKRNIAIEDLQAKNPAYAACKVICNYLNIEIASLTEIQSGAGNSFSIEEIARLSKFPVREISLDAGWWKNDNGPLVVLSKQESEETKYFACIPKTPNKYIVFDPETNSQQTLTAEIAASLSGRGYMIYRPFATGKISLLDLLMFGYKAVWKSDILKIVLFTLIATLIGLLLPRLSQSIFDDFIPEGDRNALWQMGLLVLVFVISSFLVYLTRAFAVLRAGNKMKYTVQNAAFDRLLNLPVDFFGKYDSGELASRAMGLAQIFTVISETAVSVVLSAVFSLLYLWQMTIYSTQLAWTGLFMVFGTMLITFVFGYIQMSFEKRQIETNNKLTAMMYQLLLGIGKIRVSGSEERASYRWSNEYLQFRKITLDKEKIANINLAINSLLITAFTIAIYHKTAAQQMAITFGEFAAFMTAFGLFSAAGIQLAQIIVKMNKLKPVYDKARPILETSPENQEKMILPGELKGAIEISNINFRYEADGPQILRDISFSVDPGEYIGIVGPSGSGKSTLFKILLGFETPEIGKVFYDDKDLETIDKRELRKKMGVVLQDGQVISGSILENITITNSELEMEKVQEVIRQVGLESDIADLPMGIHTLLMEDASTISGGQKQRILIARAIANNPRLVFFDEATSALDNITQAAIAENLDKMNVTRIVIAHRLSTVINCDRIIVIDKGRIAEQGTYDELMARKGLFYKMATRQIA